jgi:UDP-N-acetylglucosamine 2-epimerase (non-hydrolysing)
MYCQLTEQGYFLVSAHREENVDLLQICSALSLNALAASLRTASHRVYSSSNAQKNGSKGLAAHESNISQTIWFSRLSKTTNLRARTVLISGMITEESSILNFPALNLRETHERSRRDGRSLRMMVALRLTEQRSVWT